MRLRIIFVLMMFTLFTICIDLFAQSVDEDFEVAQSDKSFSTRGIQYGAILSPIYLFENNNGIKDKDSTYDGKGKLGSYMLNAKVWAKAYLWSNSFFYIRGKNSYLGVITNTESYKSYESDNLLDLDLAYLSMLFSNINISVGRNYYTVGTGLVLNGRGDGAELAWNSSFFSINLLGLYTGLLIKDDNPYKLNDKDITDGADRMFGAGTISAFFYNQKLYVFGLAQIDLADQTKGKETKYDSQYYGVGLDGVLFSNLSYYAEFVYETGTSYIMDASNLGVPYEKSNISAYAINSGFYYYIPVALNPMLIFQYSFGSGDRSRPNYGSSNKFAQDMNGDFVSGDDRGFIAFGNFAGGYALRPYLGNMHIIRGGFSFAPFKAMSLGAKYLYYLKHKKEALINSGEAFQPKAFIGQGIDVSLRWQISFDLSMYVNYGVFLPGDAYDDSDPSTNRLYESKKARNFFMAGVNLSI